MTSFPLCNRIRKMKIVKQRVCWVQLFYNVMNEYYIETYIFVSECVCACMCIWVFFNWASTNHLFLWRANKKEESSASCTLNMWIIGTIEEQRNQRQSASKQQTTLRQGLVTWLLAYLTYRFINLSNIGKGRDVRSAPYCVWKSGQEQDSPCPSK